jgi:hypothetical protein
VLYLVSRLGREFTGYAGPMSISSGTWLIHEAWASMNWVRYLAEEEFANAYVAASVSKLNND